jgi:hypothetical protein
MVGVPPSSFWTSLFCSIFSADDGSYTAVTRSVMAYLMTDDDDDDDRDDEKCFRKKL